MFRSLVVRALVVTACLASSVTATAAGISYRYDSLNRLVSVDYGNGMSIGYTYDAAGNLLRVARDAGGADLVPPTVSDFSLPPASNTFTVAVTAFAATDNVGVTGYCIATADSPSGCTWSGPVPDSYTFPHSITNGPHTLYAFARDAAGNVSQARPASVSLALPQLSVTINCPTSSAASVNSNPAGIACVSGSAANCSALFDSATPVTLHPTGANATFSFWSGDLTGGANPGTITMNGNKTVIATFTPDPARVVIDGSSTPYYTIAAALDACSQDSAIRALSSPDFGETIILTTSHTLKLRGGFTDATFTDISQTGYSTISGWLKIRAGKLIAQRVKVRP